MDKKGLLLTGLALVVFFAASASPASVLLKREYRGFTLWLDCEVNHGAVAFYYELGPNKIRSRPKTQAFKFDRKVPLSCQPQSWRSYRTTTVHPADGTWDRGQLVPPRHMDEGAGKRRETYLLTNTLPQASVLNGIDGAWHQTEMITDCYGEITRLKIWGGVIWGHNKENDFFTATHGIATPDYWWKLIYRSDQEQYFAWIFPNNRSATADKIDQYLVSLEALKSRVDILPEIEALQNLGGATRPSRRSHPLDQAGPHLRCE